MAKKIEGYNAIWSGILDPKTGEFSPTDITVEANVSDPDAVKVGNRVPYVFRQPFPWDGNLTLDQLKQIIEQKILADI